MTALHRCARSLVVASNIRNRKTLRRKTVAIALSAIFIGASTAVAQPPQPEPYCYAVADSGDNLVVINKDGTNFLDLGATGTSLIEAIAFNPSDATLYAINGDDFGFLDYADLDGDGNDSEFVTISTDVGTCVLPGGGTVNINDVDGLQFDLTRTDPSTGTNVLWGTVRSGDGGAPDDILVQIDPTTGLVDTTPTPGFSGGATCVRISGAGVLPDADDLAIDPTDGTLYVVSNVGNDTLITVDPVTGTGTVIGTFDDEGTAITDMEGLSFGLDGALYGTTGSGGSSPNDLWLIDTTSGDTSMVAPFPTLFDYEAVACLLDNLVTGAVFFDADEDGLFEPADGDAGFSGATVNVYIDNNNDGQVDPGDTLLETVVTVADGSYVVPVAQGNFVAEVDTTTLPAGFVLTTDTLEEADFANIDYGLTDPDNDFGFTLPPGSGELDITKTSDATGAVVPGQTLTYTVVVENNSGITHNEIEVSDLLPAGVSYVAESTVVTGPNLDTYRDEFSTVAYDNSDGTIDWSADPWAEGNDDGAAATGSIRIAAFELQLEGTGGNPQRTIERQFDLTGASSASFSFDWRCVGDMEQSGGAGDFVFIEISSNGGGSWTTLQTKQGEVDICVEPADNDAGSDNFDVSSLIDGDPTDSRIRFRYTISATNEDFFLDNVDIAVRSNVTLDNLPAGANADLIDGVPPNLVEIGDGFVLEDGDSMTVTFSVTVDDPLDPDITQLLNIATADSAESTVPATDQVVDPVNPGAVIGDTVWLDIDGDGVEDIGEEGIANVAVELIADPDGIPNNGDEFVAATTTTDADGNYLFDHIYPLPPGGSYTVEVDATTVPDGLTESPGNNAGVSGPIVVTGEQAFLDADFGYTAPAGSAVIGDYIWSDADNDGVQDPGEPGIGGVTVNLLDAATGAVVDTATTDSDGSYLFTGVVPDEYRVEIDATNFLPGAALESYTVTSGPQSQGAETSTPIDVADSDVFVDADFGYNQPGLGSVGNQIWYDDNGDGVRDVGEDGIAGVTVDLFSDLDGDGTLDSGEPVIATVTSAADGSYQFDGLALDDGDGDADYLVVVSDTDGVLADLGGTRGTAGLNNNSQTDPYSVALSAATPSNDSADFGYNAPGTLGDRVWSDANGDGIEDASEAGIGGIVMALVQDPGADGLFGTSDDIVLATTSTDADGDYQFSGLPQGNYTVVADVGADGIPASGDETLAAAGYTQTGDPEGDNDGLGASSLVLGGSDQSLDFGYQNTALANLSGTVFEDLDGDGVEEAGEGGIEGVTLVLLDDLGNILAMTTTDANGDYTFPDLPDGDYTVSITDDAGVLNGYELTSGLDALDATVAGSDVTDVDFGYTQTPNTGSIGDTVYLDADGDGIQDAAEAGLPGVTVNLLDELGNPVLDGMGAPVTATTNANGRYVFPDLPPAVYFVEVDATTLPAGLDSTTGGETSSTIAVSEAEMYVDADFGYAPTAGTATIGDRVWADVDGDGLQDPGEIGIAGVELTIDGPGGTFTVTTGVDGSWLATGLAPGDYFVTVDTSTLPTGYLPTPTNTDLTYGITLAADDLFTQLDYGFDGATTGTLGDTLYLDENGDASQDPGEEGIAGATLNVLDVGGNIIGTTVTSDGTTDVDGDGSIDPIGSYAFQGLPAGDYTVEVTDIDGVLTGLNPTEVPAGAFTITAAGETFDTVDFGYSPATAGSGVIGDFLWHDRNADGVQDADEPGLEGITLDLWLDVDGDGVITPGVDNLLTTTTTDANGAYEFNGLAPGDYLVEVTDTGGVLAGFVETFDPDEAGVCVVCDGLGAVTVADGATEADIDFGYGADPAMAFSISGTAFEDQNADANFDSPGEPVVPGATVRLFRVVNGESVLFATTTTDSNGEYTFDDLPPGDYLVEVDASGSPVDGFVQTTQGGTDGLQPVTITTADVVDQDFGYWSAGILSTPITLAYFHAEQFGGSVRFEWLTATEVGNVGFHLFALQRNGMVRLNGRLVASTVIDSIEPQSYTFEADIEATNGSRQFFLEAVDIYGRSRFHGPFALDRPAGARQAEPQRTDWTRIRSAHESARDERLASAYLNRHDGPAPKANLSLSEDGVYRVTYEALLAGGVDFGGVPLDELALISQGEPVPIYINSADPSDRFGPGAYIEFIGTALDTLYTKTNVYRLTADRDQAARIPLGSNVPFGEQPEPFYIESLRVEENRAYSFSAPGDDPWYDRTILAFSGPAETSLEFELDEWAAGSAPIELTVELWGGTNFPTAPDHHVIVDVNESTVADVTFDGLVAQQISAELPDSLVEEGVNDLRLTLPYDTDADFDLVRYDRYQVKYPRRFVARDGRLTFTASGKAYRVSGLSEARVGVYRVGGKRVQRLRQRTVGAPGNYSTWFPGSERTGTYYVTVESEILTPRIAPTPIESDITSAESELLIVSHPDFIDTLEPFAELKRSAGWSTEVVDVEAIYEQFGDGIFDPEAIRDYIGYAHERLGTVAVLLVGGDTYDYHGYLDQRAVQFLPSLYAATDDIVRFSPVDPLYGDIDGDQLVDLAVGRWPVRTVDELSAVIDKTLQYDNGANSQTAVFSAEVYDLPTGFSFTAASEAIAGILPPDWQIERAYIDELGVEEARNRLLDEMNTGVALASYFGHSGPTSWSFSDLFNTTDAAALENDQPMIVTQWGCWNTYYVAPSYDTLGHELLLARDHGAAAVLGAATLTEARSEQLLGPLVFEELAVPGTTLGGAILRAKRRLAETDPERLDVLLGWTLLGDPTLGLVP